VTHTPGTGIEFLGLYFGRFPVENSACEAKLRTQIDPERPNTTKVVVRGIERKTKGIAEDGDEVLRARREKLKVGGIISAAIDPERIPRHADPGRKGPQDNSQLLRTDVTFRDR
jgi:hypothetical protein